MKKSNYIVLLGSKVFSICIVIIIETINIILAKIFIRKLMERGRSYVKKAKILNIYQHIISKNCPKEKAMY